MVESEWSLSRLLKTSGSFWEACALHAGVQLDVFTILGDASMDAEAVAERTGSDVRATGTLLNALAAMGLLAKRGEAFSNTPECRTYLVRGAADYAGHIIRHHHHLVPAWSRLPDAVRLGKPVGKKRRTENEIESFLMGMYNQAMATAPALAMEIDLSDRHQLLDLGGGPGTFSLNMLVNTKAGRAYSERDIRQMLSEGGCKDIKRLPFKGPADSGIISATV